MIVHVFVRVCSPNTGVWESLSVEQQDSLWRTLPDIVERGGLIDHLDWPKSGRHLDCAQCSLRPVLRLGAASVIKSVAWCALRQICAPCVSRKQINANVFSNKTFLKSKTDISSEQIEIGNHSNSLSNQSHQSDFASIISDPIEHIKNRIDQSRITTQY